MTFDWKSPDYAPIFNERIRRLKHLRAHPELIQPLKIYYKDHVADFISEWGCTYDPRNLERGLPASVPFILFPKQREFVDWIIEAWLTQDKRLAEKSRDFGLSWLLMSVASSLCLFYNGLSIGCGSNLERNVDDSENPDALFWKARMFLEELPPEFNGGYERNRDAKYMKIAFRETGSTLTGSSGKEIGRGGRKSIQLIDEAASLEHPLAVDAALSQTSNCRIDVSTPRGMANPFAQKRFSGKFKVFTCHWRDDPRKDEAWYQKQKRELDPVIVAQEIDLDYSASVEGVVIPSAWVQSAVDAHIKLGVNITGRRSASLDVADEGRDTNAFCGAHGILIEHIEEWPGGGSSIYATTQRAMNLCDEHEYDMLRFDSDGLGAGVRGDAIAINERRVDQGQKALPVEPFRGSEGVFEPDGWATRDRRNKDYYKNRKAQSWMGLRRRFELTHRAVTSMEAGEPMVDAPHDELISISSKIPSAIRQKLLSELSQPTYKEDTLGKILINKAPEGAKSPNLADSVMIKFAPTTRRVMMFTEADIAVLAG